MEAARRKVVGKDVVAWVARPQQDPGVVVFVRVVATKPPMSQANPAINDAVPSAGLH